MLFVDIPTQPELHSLVAARGEASVSIYLATTPETQDVGAARIQLGNLLKQAEAQLEAAGTDKRVVWPISEQINDLIDDEEFWSLQATSLAVFATPDSLRTYRLPTRVTETVQVADRFHLKPLLRAVSVPQHAFVLALAENEIRLIELVGDAAAEEVKVPGMPRDAASAVGTSNVNSRSHSGRIGGGEGQNVRLRQYCRKVDAALRPLLAGRSEPLIVAATDPLLSIFRSACSYGRLSTRAIETSPVRIPASELGARAREIMDAEHADTLKGLLTLYAQRENEGRGTTQIARAARAATFGAVDTLLVDIDEVVAGRIDEESGEVSFAEAEGAGSYGIVDEIAGRVLVNGGKVYGVRKGDIPQEASLAAILRFAI